MSSVFPPGVQLATRYRVLRLLETNHVGALFEAERIDTRRRVALKWLRFAASGAAQLAHDRAAHARAASLVRHPQLAVVHDVALEGNSLFVVSELLTGESLRTRLAPHAMPLHERLRALADAMRAMEFAHQRGLVHGSLHPGNIFLHQEHDACFGLPPAVKVVDFGTATTTLPASLAYPVERTAFGAHAYLDHAQLCGEEPDARSDIYAFGALLFQALTGAVPYQAKTPIELAIKLASSPVPTIGDRHPGLPALLDAQIRQSLRQARSERPQQLERLFALTSAYAETLASHELMSADDPLHTRRMIKTRAAPGARITQLLTALGKDLTAPAPPPTSQAPMHPRHPPAYAAALRDAEFAAAAELAQKRAAPRSAVPAVYVRPTVTAPASQPAPAPASQPTPVARHTECAVPTSVEPARYAEALGSPSAKLSPQPEPGTGGATATGPVSQRVTGGVLTSGSTHVDRSKRLRTWSAAVAAILVVAGISVSFAMATNRDARTTSAPPALPSSLAREKAARLDVQEDTPDEGLRPTDEPRLPTQAVATALDTPVRTEQPAASDPVHREEVEPTQPKSLARKAPAPDEPAPSERRHSARARGKTTHRARQRERPQEVEPAKPEEGYLVGPLPTADQF